MPRSKRLIPINAAMHIVCRGNNKQDIFKGEGDKLRYYSLLKEFEEENRVTIFHYCLMNNHVHLLVWLDEKSKVSRFMKQVNLTYFNYFNKIYSYVGHLWQGRFKSNIIDTDSYLLQCGKYIELNPLRAGLVYQAQDYAFSSYNHYANGKPDSLLSNNPMYIGLANSEEQRRNLYINFVVDTQLVNKDILIKRFKRGKPKNI